MIGVSNVNGLQMSKSPKQQSHPKNTSGWHTFFLNAHQGSCSRQVLDSRENFNSKIYIDSIFCCNYMEWPQQGVKSPVKAVAVAAPLSCCLHQQKIIELWELWRALEFPKFNFFLLMY